MNEKFFFWVCFAILIFFNSQATENRGCEKTVVLNSAVSPILEQLDLENCVVGTIYNDHLFSGAARVGSHLSPNVELIRVLKPGIIIAGSKRAFPDHLKDRLGVEVFRYDPGTLDEILDDIQTLGSLYGKEKEAQILVTRLGHKIQLLKRPSKSINVVYEISQRPLKFAGQKNIISDIVLKAGGINLVSVNKKHVLLSPEKILMLEPDLYIYQDGPMNKNPTAPQDRFFFKTLKSKILKVNQLSFTRPGINAFDAANLLNRKFLELKQ